MVKEPKIRTSYGRAEFGLVRRLAEASSEFEKVERLHVRLVNEPVSDRKGNRRRLCNATEQNIVQLFLGVDDNRNRCRSPDKIMHTDRAVFRVALQGDGHAVSAGHIIAT